jgi:hypothetical protein
MKVISVEPLSDYRLRITFDDGISGMIDLKDFVKIGVFSSLQNVNLFNEVYTNGYSIAWSDELEIDPLTVYAELSGKTPEDVLSANFNYAAN